MRPLLSRVEARRRQTVSGGIAHTSKEAAERPVGIADVLDQPVPQVRQGLGRQIFGASCARLPQGLDPLNRLLMLADMGCKALVNVEPHERFFRGEVHLGEIDELVEGACERLSIGPAAKLRSEAVEQIQLQRVLPIDLRRADRETARALRFRCRHP